MNPIFSRGLRRTLSIMLPVGVIGGALLVAHQAHVRAANSLSVACYGDLNATTYPGGVAAAPLGSSNGIQPIPGTGLRLDTNLVPFNAQNIVLPFDQQLNVKYVYRNAGASHSFGWFYIDQIAQFRNPDGSLKDQDADGIPDWFQTQKLPNRPNDGLWHITSGATPDLLNSGLSYSDGGAYPHIPNLLETLTGPGKGSMIFKLCDDDGDTSTYNVGGTPGSSPISDIVATSDGIPDYDVNGDGTAGNAADRAVNLGVVQGGREIVFFAITYYDTSLPNLGLGTGTTGSSSVKVFPYFTKNLLNPDRGSKAPGTVLKTIAINTWLDAATNTRLNTPVYNNTNLAADTSTRSIVVGADASAPHFVVMAPASNPNLWLIAQEDLPANVADNDFNDVVFMVERTNGGQAISQVLSNDIPVALQATTAISKVRVQYNVNFPAPGCTGVTGAQINLYYSVDDGATWRSVPMASLTSGDVIIDVLGAGAVGSKLRWRADFVSPVQSCEPTLTNINVSYEAVSNGKFKYGAPIPLSNVVYGGSLETPPFPATEPLATRNDFSLRGHFDSNRLYEPNSPNSGYGSASNPTLPPLNWDAGAVIASRGPDTRNIVTSVAGTTVPLTTAYGPVLYPLILPPLSRTALLNATLVYDFNGDNLANDTDAQFVLQWTRGWEFPSGITFTPAQAVAGRGWRLGSIHNSSPAIVGPPVRPLWIDGSAAPASLIAKHNTFLMANKTRPTRAIVGVQDGMIHAFDAGQYRTGSDPTCPATLNRGCYAGATDPARYGLGDEVWAWVPPSQLSQLKNNHPSTRNYLPGSNPLAEVDGSVSVEDIWDPGLAGGGGFRTLAFASLGTSQRYLTAVDMTNDAPKAVWANDFTDADFNGSNLSPSVALAKVPGMLGYQHLVVTSSGLSTLVDDLYIYLIDALTGTVAQKIQLNTGAGLTAQTYGIASYVSLVDANQDGLVDRAYAVDTAGRIWKVDTTTNQKCMIASTGESVFAGMALTVTGSVAAPKVEIFVGGGSNPDGTGTILPGYHVFAFEDANPVGTCTNNSAALVYSLPLAPGDKVWAAPFVTGASTPGSGNVFFATANAPSVSICANGNGTLLQVSTGGDGSGNPASQGASQNIGGAPISSLRVYDGHAIVNTVGGSTTVLGGSVWNNAATGTLAGGGTVGAGLINTMRTLLWQEY